MSILIKNAGADYSNSGLLYSKALKLAFETYKTASNADAIRIVQKYDPTKVLWFYNDIDLSGNVLEFAIFLGNASEVGSVQFDVIDLINKRRVVLTTESTTSLYLRYISESVKKRITITSNENLGNNILFVKLNLTDGSVFDKKSFIYSRQNTLTTSSTNETDTDFTSFDNPNLINGIRIQGDKTFNPINNTVYRFRGLRVSVDNRDVFACQTFTNGIIHDWVSGKNFNNATTRPESYTGDSIAQVFYTEIKKSNESL